MAVYTLAVNGETWTPTNAAMWLKDGLAADVPPGPDDDVLLSWESMYIIYVKGAVQCRHLTTAGDFGALLFKGDTSITAYGDVDLDASASLGDTGTTNNTIVCHGSWSHTAATSLGGFDGWIVLAGSGSLVAPRGGNAGVSCCYLWLAEGASYVSTADVGIGYRSSINPGSSVGGALRMDAGSHLQTAGMIDIVLGGPRDGLTPLWLDPTATITADTVRLWPAAGSGTIKIGGGGRWHLTDGLDLGYQPGCGTVPDDANVTIHLSRPTTIVSGCVRTAQRLATNPHALRPTYRITHLVAESLVFDEPHTASTAGAIVEVNGLVEVGAIAVASTQNSLFTLAMTAGVLRVCGGDITMRKAGGRSVVSVTGAGAGLEWIGRGSPVALQGESGMSYVFPWVSMRDAVVTIEDDVTLGSTKKASLLRTVLSAATGATLNLPSGGLAVGGRVTRIAATGMGLRAYGMTDGGGTSGINYGPLRGAREAATLDRRAVATGMA